MLEMQEYSYYEGKSCIRSQCYCLCGFGSCRFCCRFCPRVRESVSTRCSYVAFLLFWVVIMAIFISGNIQRWLMDMFPDHALCRWLGAEQICEIAIGYMAVYRLGFAIFMYHIIMMFVTFGVKTSQQCRAGLHNGMWLHKFLLQLGLCVGAFLIPDPRDDFIMIWMYSSMAGASAFIVLQFVLLIYMLHSWTSKIMVKIDSGGSVVLWYGGVMLPLIVLGFVLCIVIAIVCFSYFAFEAECHTNKWLIGVNVGCCIIVAVITAVRKGANPLYVRLLPSALVSAYIMYITWSALSSAPRRHQIRAYMDSHPYLQKSFCGPTYEDSWVDIVLPYISFALMFCAVVYACFAVAKAEGSRISSYLESSTGFPASMTVEDSGGQNVIRDEKDGIVYSYYLFHIMMALATLFIMMSLTSWYSPTSGTFGRSWSAVWVKISSAWVCLCIYFAVILFPDLLPEQKRSLSRSSSRQNGFVEDEAAVPLTTLKSAGITRLETTV